MTRTATRHEAEHRITVAAPADRVYQFIVRAQDWPWIFPPSIHVQQLETGEGSERIRIWATANGEVKTWTSRRILDLPARTVRFWQETSQPPVAEMVGTWSVEPRSDVECLVRLRHTFRAVDDDPDSVSWIRQAIDRNSDSELATLRTTAEQSELDRLRLSFADDVHIRGSGEAVYDFLHAADRWADRLPHVASVRLDEPAPGVQDLAMETIASDGSSHATRSIRVCLPHHGIVYKQLHPPALLTTHIGQWEIEPEADGVRVTSRHTIVVKPDAVPTVLGADATVEQARDYVRRALSANSAATLSHAKAHVEGGSDG